MLPIGHVLNDTYRIERLLGQGGMAAVYVVQHMRMPRRFALKIIATSLTGQPMVIERFRREADILGALDHPNIVNVTDCNVYQQQFPYLVMELLDGHDLAHFLAAQNGPLSPAVALPIFLQIAEALDAAHSAGIIHRDLKPANVFLCKRGPFPNFIKVLDFGIAKVSQPNSACQTQNSTIMGTPAYMAPEQALGHNDRIDARTDQFALAAILYEMLSGCPAFFRPGEPTLMTLTRVVYEDPEPLVGMDLGPVVQRALSKDPNLRYPTLRAFVEATGVLEFTGSLRILEQSTRQLPAPAPIPPADELAQKETQRKPMLRWKRLLLYSLAGMTAAPLIIGLGMLGLRRAVRPASVIAQTASVPPRSQAEPQPPRAEADASDPSADSPTAPEDSVAPAFVETTPVAPPAPTPSRPQPVVEAPSVTAPPRPAIPAAAPAPSAAPAGSAVAIRAAGLDEAMLEQIDHCLRRQAKSLLPQWAARRFKLALEFDIVHHVLKVIRIPQQVEPEIANRLDYFCFRQITKLDSSMPDQIALRFEWERSEP